MTTNLSARCLNAAEGLWKQPRTISGRDIDDQICAASELLIATGKQEYKDYLLSMTDSIARRISSVGWMVVRTIPVMQNPSYQSALEKALTGFSKDIIDQEKETPFRRALSSPYLGCRMEYPGIRCTSVLSFKIFPQIVQPGFHVQCT